MSKKHHHVRVLIHRAFAVFLTVFLISDVGRVYASRNLQIIAQQKETQLDITRVEAEKLTSEGFQLFEQGTAESLTKAREKWQAALVLWKKLEDKSRQAFTLLAIGGVYSNLGEKQKALSYSKQALPLFRSVSNKGGEATTLNNIGRIYDELGEKQKALSYYNHRKGDRHYRRFTQHLHQPRLKNKLFRYSPKLLQVLHRLIDGFTQEKPIKRIRYYSATHFRTFPRSWFNRIISSS